MVIRPGGYTRLFSSYRGPLSVIVQGMLVAFIGLALLVFNLNDSAPYQKLTGHVAQGYDETLDGMYDSSWIQLDSSSNLFNYVDSDFQPSLTQPFFKGQKIVIYYTLDTPPRVVAIQTYDQFGDPGAKYATSEYAQNPNAYSTGIGPIPGVVVLLIGLLAIAFGAFRYKQARDRKREEAEEAARPSRRPALYATMPPKYVSPSKSLPPQDDSATDFSFKEYRE
ncbi:MAG: hypothetical protein WCD86_16110 [Ktedonobacteraceae bacterium]